jgi:hypothetical protein
MAKNNMKVVPAAKQALDQMKYEIAAELGINVGASVQGPFGNAEFATELGQVPGNANAEEYWGHISARDAGAVGGHITRRLIQRSEETLFSLS